MKIVCVIEAPKIPKYSDQDFTSAPALGINFGNDFPLNTVLDGFQNVIDNGHGRKAWLRALEYPSAHEDGVPPVFAQWRLVELLPRLGS